MTVQITKWRQLVAPNAEGATGEEIDVHVLLTARDLCERTGVWQKTLDAIDVSSGKHEYPLAFTAVAYGADVVEVTSALLDGAVLTPVSIEILNAREPEWRGQRAENPTRFFVTPDRTLCLVNPPAKDHPKGLVIHAFLRPSSRATSVPEFLYNEYYHVIADGAAARLLRMSGNRKETIPMADYFDEHYKLGVARAKLKASQGLTRAPLKGHNYFF